MSKSRSRLLIAGGAALLAAAVFVALYARPCACGDDGPFAGYYFEARFTAEGPNAQSYEPTTEVVRTWFKVPNQMRQERYEERDGQLVMTQASYYDGEKYFEYNALGSTYYVPPGTMSIDERGVEVGTYLAFTLGPVLMVRDMENALGPTGIAGWSRVGDERFLGRDVVVVEIKSRPVGGKGESEHITAWIDPKRVFAMRYSIRRQGVEGVIFNGEVTYLDYNPVFAKDTFEFRPPPGAQEKNPGEH